MALQVDPLHSRAGNQLMEASLAELVNHVPVVVRRPDGAILLWSDGCREIFGHTAEEAHGRCAHELLRTVLPEPATAIEAALERQGMWRGRVRHTTKSGEHLWTEAVFRLREAMSPPGQVVVEQHTDITRRVELEERSALLTSELEHRVKNVLAVVQALARVTFPDAPPDQRRKMETRIGALAKANKLLLGGSWKEADLRTVVGDVAGGLGLEHHLTFAGPDVMVPSDQAMNLALAVHELCTNALKYGALSASHGMVDVSWNIIDDENVRLVWRERGGPAVSEPSQTGFGTRLIREALATGTCPPADLRFEPEGVTCDIFLRAVRRP